MKYIIYVIGILAIFLLGCEKREDIYRLNNLTPTLEISTINIPVKTSASVVNDSIDIAAVDYFINYQIIDDTKNIDLNYSISSGENIELISQNTISGESSITTTGILKITPSGLGLRNIDIYATDSYGEQKYINLLLNVYRENISPILYFSTINNVGSTYLSFVDTTLTDTFNISQGNIYIEYKLIDDNLNYTQYLNTTNNGLITENISNKSTTYQTYTATVVGQLILSPTQVGNHIVTLTVVDDIGQSTNINAEIFIQ